MVEMNEWGCGLYGSADNLITYVSFCDKNTGVQVICGASYSPKNTVLNYSLKFIPSPTISLNYTQENFRLCSRQFLDQNCT